MLSKRFKNNGRAIFNLNKLQRDTINQLRKKVEKNIYQFEKIPCCVCNSENFELLSEKDRYGLYSPVVICKDCGLIQQNPRMNQESCNEFYDKEQKKIYGGEDTPTDNYFERQYKKGEKIFRYLKENLAVDLVNLKILEIGCSAGGILYYFQQKGNKIQGYDLASDYVEFGRKNYNLNLNVGTIKDISLNYNPDIIIYSHTLEHILNPVKELTQLKKVCDSNGYIYIEVPGVRSLFPGRMDFLRMLQNAHVYYFTLTTLKNVLKKAGYEFLCGDESIHSIFKPSLLDLKNDYQIENDYKKIMFFLKNVENFRVVIDFFGLFKLYKMIKSIYFKWKKE